MAERGGCLFVASADGFEPSAKGADEIARAPGSKTAWPARAKKSRK